MESFTGYYGHYFNKTTIKVATYNVNYSRFAHSSDQFRAFRWENRVDDVCALVKELDADVLLIQEVVTDCADDFESRFPEYDWCLVPNNSRGGVATVGVGCKKEMGATFFSVDFAKYGELNQKVVFARCGDTLYCSVHFPMQKEGRRSMAESFEKEMELHDHTRLVIGGDFNSFPNCYGYAQIPRMNYSCGTYSASEFAVRESDSKYATASFESYPYDAVPPEALAMVGKLDHILVKGFETLEAVVYDRKVDRRTYSPSDHYPVMVTLKE